MSAAIRSPEWTLSAACAQVDTEMFYPEKGGTTRPAKAVCARCPVVDECLDYALRTGEPFGIWGGLSERERRRLRRSLGLPKVCFRCRTNPTLVQANNASLCADCMTAESRRLRESEQAS